MNEDTAQLQREIDAEKAALSENLSTLEAKARGITDWRAQVGKHPLAAVGVALAGGLAIAMLAQRRTIVVVHRPGEDGDTATVEVPSPPLHPVVDRVIGALVAVAAAKAVDVLSDMIPGFSGHVAKDESAAAHTNGAATPPEFAERGISTAAWPS